MKLKNLKLKISSRGEIATALTLVSLGLMLLGAVAGTKLATTPQQTRSLAAYPAWDWDTASSKCADSGNKGFCICQNLGVPNAGYCSKNEVCKLGPLNKKCISNKWDDSWGCWGDATLDCKPGMTSPTPAGPTPTGPTPTGPTPTSGSGGPPSGSCTEGNWTCAGVTAEPGIRQLFCSVWCDGQNQWLWERAKAMLGDENACGGKKSAPRSGGCPDQATPVPTRPPGGGGGGGPNPPPGGGDSTEYPWGYYVIKGSLNNVSPTPSVPKLLLDINKVTYSGGGIVEIKTPTKWSQLSVKPVPNNTRDTTTGITSYNFQFGTAADNYIIASIISPIAEVAQTSGWIYFKNDKVELLSYPTDQLKICYPYGKFIGKSITVTPKGPAITITPTPVTAYLRFDEIIKFCSDHDAISTANFDAETYQTPTPTPTPNTQYSFNIIAKKSDGDSRLNVTVHGGYKGSCDISDINCYYPIKIVDTTIPGTSLSHDQPVAFMIRPGVINSMPVKVNIPSTINSITISIYANLYTLDDKNNQILIDGKKIECTGTNDFVLSKDTFTKNYNLGNLIQIDMNSAGCSISKVFNSPDTYAGSANADFQTVMDDYSQGKISAIDVSRFVSQLTRVPGLQTVTCNPTKGECNPGF